MAKYRGTGTIIDSDFKQIKYVGMTKAKKPITIIFPKAINMGNIDWTFADKDDTVAEIIFTAVYDNTDNMTNNNVEPWTIEVPDMDKASDEILLGVGIFYIGEKEVALTRGGGKFSVEREFRNIEADGDRGPVAGRIVIDASTATLTLNTLQILTRLVDLYPAMEVVTEDV